LSQERKREREQSDCQPINCKYEPLHLSSTILRYISHYNGPCGWDHLVKQVVPLSQLIRGYIISFTKVPRTL
jgi:hypothetical protein